MELLLSALKAVFPPRSAQVQKPPKLGSCESGRVQQGAKCEEEEGRESKVLIFPKGNMAEHLLFPNRII